MDLTTLSSILTAVVGLLAIFGGIYWTKFHSVLKEGAEAAMALATLLGDFKTAVKPDEDGKIRITEEEADQLIRAYETLLKEWKDVLAVFKRSGNKWVTPSVIRPRKRETLPEVGLQVLREYKPILEKLLSESSKKPKGKEKKAEVSK